MISALVPEIYHSSRFSRLLSAASLSRGEA
jgi:hypothetical protein